MRSLRRAQRDGPVGLRQVLVDQRQRREMAGDRSSIAARNRPGECRLTTHQRVLQGSSGQRRDDPSRDAAWIVTDELLTEQLFAPSCKTQRLEGIGDDRDHVIAGMGQSRVVQGSGVLAHAERLSAVLQHQGLRDRVTDFVGGGDPEAAVDQSGDVLVGAGEGHRRMNGQR